MSDSEHHMNYKQTLIDEGIDIWSEDTFWVRVTAWIHGCVIVKNPPNTRYYQKDITIFCPSTEIRSTLDEMYTRANIDFNWIPF